MNIELFNWRVTHDHLCVEPMDGFCWSCAQIAIIREDERYRVVEQLMVLPEKTNVDEVIDAIAPVNGDLLRRREPRGNIGNLNHPKAHKNSFGPSDFSIWHGHFFREGL